MVRYALSFVVALTLAACSETETRTPTYFSEENPVSLSEWGQVFVDGGGLKLGENVTPYDLNTSLFTDYAQKLRTIWMPAGLSAGYQEDDVLDFPVGTVITKTFYYPDHAGDADGLVMRADYDGRFDRVDGIRMKDAMLIETRLLVHRDTGWEVISYRWNEEQTDAILHRVGDVIPLTLVDDQGGEEAFNYIMPNVNQCGSCHAPDSNTRALSPIGPKARHLNKDYDYAFGTMNQLVYLKSTDQLTGLPDEAGLPKNAAWGDMTASIAERARDYLDINCSHCHSPVGPADTSGLILEPHTEGPNLGICKLPIAAGAGTGNRTYDIVPGHPEASILAYRMDNAKSDEMMPEIGRSTIHLEGVKLVTAWIKGLEGDCEPALAN